MYFKPNQSRVVTLLLLILVLLLAACGPTTTPARDAQLSPIADASPAVDPATPETGPVSAEGTPGATPETPVATPETTPATTPELVEEPVEDGDLVIYSGRNEQLVGPLIEQFQQETGINVAVRYGDTAEMAALILEEGRNSPADIYFGQDAGALGALAEAGRLQPLPESSLALVPEQFRASDGRWVGVSGRARVVVYNTDQLDEADLPESIFDFTDPAWNGRIGWAPTNGSFQAFVTALRVSEGEERAREWLEGIQANNPKVYANNIAVLEAVASGEVDVGFSNHYYLFRKLDEQGETFAARNYFFPGQDIGNLVNIAGVGIVDTARHSQAAQRFVEFLLSEEAQQYFRNQTREYPLIEGVEADPMLPALNTIQTPNLDLNRLEDLEGTLELLQELGIL